MSESVKNSFCFFKRFAALIGDVFESSRFSESETCGDIRFFIRKTIQRIIFRRFFGDFCHHAGKTAHNFDKMKDAFSHCHNFVTSCFILIF